MDYPKLRNIEAFPIEMDGQNAICLRDPSQLPDKIIAIPYNTFFIVSQFDGKHSILDIQEAYTRKFGDLLLSDKINQIIDVLDENFFLDNDNFVKHKQSLIDEFKKSSIRQASHSGLSYSSNPKELNEYLESLFKLSDAAGEPNPNNHSRKISALIAPHIDFHRGGFCYTYAYKELAEAESPDYFLILGIAHSEAKSLFVATKKDFVTPLGTAETDKDFVDELSSRCKFDLFEDEFAHRNEHSIEFQIVFLQYIIQKYHPNIKNPKIIPILCSSFDQMYLSDTQPMDVPEVKEFIQALKSIISERREKICIIAGVDLSHIGRHFGDDFNLSQTILQNIENEDKKLISAIEKLDKREVFGSVQKDFDQRKICGLPAIYTLLSLLEETNVTEAKLLKYSQSVNMENQLMVSFASMAFYS